MVARLLIYSQDGLGLGHLRRARNIAREVLAREPECSVLILADSPAVPFFPPLPGIDYLKIPTLIRTGRDDWRTDTLSRSTSEVVNLRARIIQQAFWEFRPDVILVDHLPLGALGELKPMLDGAMGGTRPAKLFLGLRDILDSPPVIRQAWTEVGAYDYLRKYDSVLIYGCRELYDAGSAYQVTPHAQQVTYCNYIAPVRQASASVRASAAEPLILVMGGGGADAFPLAGAFLEALPVLLREIKLRAVILTGPNIPPSHHQALLAQSAPYSVQIRCEDATSWLPEACAVVTMAGYNSLCEVLTWRKKALVVPRAGPSAEQRIRSQLFSRRRLIRTLDPDDLTAERLARELIRLLSEDEIPKTSNIPPLNGGPRAASVILNGPTAAETPIPAGRAMDR